MKATYLFELAKMHSYFSKICKGQKTLEDLDEKASQYFHWFYYSDSDGKWDNQWPGSLKIIVKNVKTVKK